MLESLNERACHYLFSKKYSIIRSIGYSIINKTGISRILKDIWKTIQNGIGKD